MVTAFGAFFVVLTFVLLTRYRWASQAISESSERSSDVWQALQERLKKQDERIVDLMTRVEVLQSRMVAPGPPAPAYPVMTRDAMSPQQVTQQRPTPKPRQTGGALGGTAAKVIEFLSAGPKSTIAIKEEIGLSREHTARTMKELFDDGFVARDDSAKPFVYQLTEKGRSYFSSA